MFKIRWSKTNTIAAIYACAVLAITLTGICIVVNIASIYHAVANFFTAIAPLVYALALAYLFNPLLKLLEKQVISRIKWKKKKIAPGIRRCLSLILTYVAVALFFFLIGLLIIPEIVGNHKVIIEKTTAFLMDAVEKAGTFLGFDAEETGNLSENISKYGKLFLTYIGQAGAKFALFFLQFLLGLFISFFVLMHKEKLIASTKKLLASILRPRAFNRVMSITRMTDRTFGRYFIGSIFDAMVVGVLSFIVFTVFRMPYAPLLSVILAITNIIPYFGPIIGTVPCAILVLTESAGMAFWMVVMVLIIQQVDANIIAPKILGNATGLSSLWVVVAITVMGSFFGFIGMLIGVPFFSVLYTIVKEQTEKRLQKRGLSIDTRDYADEDPLSLLESSAGRNEPTVYETEAEHDALGEVEPLAILGMDAAPLTRETNESAETAEPSEVTETTGATESEASDATEDASPAALPSDEEGGDAP